MASNGVNSQGKLSDRQLLALPHLVTSTSVTEAAELSGVPLRTIQRWMNDEEFRAAYEEQRDAVAFYARSGMRTLMLKALAVQVERLDSDDPKERARAAKVIMDYDVKTAPKHESQKLLNRLHSFIYSTDNRVLDQPTINFELEQYLNSHHRPDPAL